MVPNIYRERKQTNKKTLLLDTLGVGSEWALLSRSTIFEGTQTGQHIKLSRLYTADGYPAEGTNWSST